MMELSSLPVELWGFLLAGWAGSPVGVKAPHGSCLVELLACAVGVGVGWQGGGPVL